MTTAEMMTTRAVTKEFAADDAGLFAAKVSAFGNEDLNGERVLKGAFKRTIQALKDAGKMLPVVWSHQHDQVPIGEIDPNDIRETDAGLVVAGKFFLDDPEALSVWKAMRRGLITAWSFAFTPVEERVGKDGVREIMDLDLYEVGPTLIGANPEAQTIALKAIAHPDEPATDTKRGRRISAATASVLERMRQELDSLLSEGVDEDDDQEQASAPLSEAERLRLQLAELDAYLSERGRT
jgi:hypothetical protein